MDYFRAERDDAFATQFEVKTVFFSVKKYMQAKNA